MTLPMIHFLRTRPAEHRALAPVALDSRDADKVEKIRNLILPSNSIEYAHDRARAAGVSAQQAIETLADTEARRAMQMMAEFVVSRPM